MEELEDILDTLVFEDEPSIFSEEHAVELVETALHLMSDYLERHPDTELEDVLEEIKDIFSIQMEDHIANSDYVEDDMHDILEVALNLFIASFQDQGQEKEDEDVKEEEDQDDVKKEDQDDVKKEDPEKQIIAQKIEALRQIPQPVQRTPEWYQFRWNLITASSAWKAFDTQSSVNQLIYEKCQPLKSTATAAEDETKEVTMVNTSSTLHWGQKYEPLSVMLYEFLYDSKVEDFGCIQHPTYSFIGASPDGIVVQSNTGRYGRMLEIKNIVNREITGIPKREYWVQMQLQMEVCDLNECDFLETKFVEYANSQEYNNDTEAKFKGMIMYFHSTKEGKPRYEYMPLDCPDVEEWAEHTLHFAPPDVIFVKYIYWKLEKMSCIVVKRDREWFANHVGQLEKVWKIIEQERITGFQHRAPNRREKKEKTTTNPITPEVCFLKVVKL